MVARFLIFVAILVALLTAGVCWMTTAGEAPVIGPRRTLTEDEEKIGEKLQMHVRELSFQIGPRSNRHSTTLRQTAEYIDASLASFGYRVTSEAFTSQSQKLHNVIAERRGSTKPDDILLLGAHYDSYRRSPGANANASGVAVLLELARVLRNDNPTRSIRLAFFANGERPFLGTEGSGSFNHATGARARSEDIRLMVCLDTIGYYSDKEGSQSFPFPLNLRYPSTGDFLAIIGGLKRRDLVTKIVTRWAEISAVPAYGGALPGWFPGVLRSDHEIFESLGYPAVLLTDTAENRWRDARTVYDKFPYLDYKSLAQIVTSLEALTLELANGDI